MSSKKISLADWQQQLGGQSTPKPTTPTVDGLVYSTDSGRIDTPKAEKSTGPTFADGFLRLKRETKGRNGKGVITIAGIAESEEKLSEIAALLKKKCGCGGAVKDGIIEIQGDKREEMKRILTAAGFKPVVAGG